MPTHNWIDAERLVREKQLKEMYKNKLVDIIPTSHGIVFGQEPRNEPTLMEMLAMRMRWTNGHPFHHVSICKSKSGDRVFICIVGDKEPVWLEDEWNMYPSDALVSKLRLL